MYNNITMTPDGMYDEYNQPITLEELIERCKCKGGKIEKEIEERIIYIMLDDGNIEVKNEIYDVITFKQETEKWIPIRRFLQF